MTNCSSTSSTMRMPHFLRLVLPVCTALPKPTTWTTRACAFNTVKRSQRRPRKATECSASASGPALVQVLARLTGPRFRSPSRTSYRLPHPRRDGRVNYAYRLPQELTLDDSRNRTCGGACQRVLDSHKATLPSFCGSAPQGVIDNGMRWLTRFRQAQ